MFEIAYFDWKEQRIKNRDCLLLFLLGIFQIVSGSSLSPVSRVAGAFCISMPMLFLAMLYPGGFGGGDMKLMAAGGFFLGWKEICMAMEIAVFLSAGYAVWMMIKKKAKRKARFALGPFLCMGMAIASIL